MQVAFNGYNESERCIQVGTSIYYMALFFEVSLRAGRSLCICIIVWPTANMQRPHIDGLVQERRNSIALAMELRLSSTNPSIDTVGDSSYPMAGCGSMCI